MKTLLILSIVIFGSLGKIAAQNVFNPADPLIRYSSSASYGSAQRPDTNIVGIQKWVATSTNGVSSGSGSFNSNSYKAYFINFFNTRIAFRIKFPRSYTNPDSVNKKYPVMLFMHGAGEVGCPSNGGIYNNEKQLVHGGKLFMDRVDNNEFDGYLLYPQLKSPDGQCWGEWGGGANARFVTIMTMIDSLAKYARLDNDRVFVDGLSGGGVAAWRLAENFPTRIAKIAPTSGAGLIMNYPAFVHIPVWLATGGRDSNPSPAMASYSELKVTEIGGEMRRSLYADLGHSSWYRHWEEPDFVAYMNDVHKANPLIFFNRFEFCPDSGVNARIGITQGFYEYEWEKDGEVIARRVGNVNTVVKPEVIRSYAGNEITVREFGTYRVRFRRTNNSSWSDWSRKPAVIKSKATTQTPPIAIVGVRSKVLPSPDNKTSVTLQLPAGFQNYSWVRTSDNVIVSNGQIYEAPVGTYKARYSENFGCGTEYSPVFKVVNANGNPKPDPAKNLNVTTLSQTSLRLDWSDNPNAGTNETGFEIYRATKAGGPYSLIKITLPNVITFSDSALNPNTTYYYIIRAVSETGAAIVSNESSGKTDIDNQLPTAPSGLEYRGSTSTTIRLRWKAATDNAGIGRYDIYANGSKLYSTTGLSFTVGNLDSLRLYTFFVKAVDKAGNLSPASNQVTGFTHQQGLKYKYYHGSYSTLPNFNSLSPVKTGIMDTVNAGTGVRQRDDNFAFLWEGRIYIPVTGTYTFETASDDGSKLYIDVPYSGSAASLINNDGAHSVQSRTGTKHLTQGYHIFAVTFAEVSGDEEMSLYWSNSVGLSRERIPKGFFAINDLSVRSVLTAPSSLVATALAYNKIRLQWTDNSNNETGFEIVRSGSLSDPFVPVFTTGINTTNFTDSGLNASSTYYYKIRAINAETESPFVSAYTEGNWKFNNNYNESGSGLSINPSSTSFSTDRPEGSHSVSFSSGDYLSFNGGSSSFPSSGGYHQRTVALWIKPSSTSSKRMIFEFGGNDNGMGLRFNSDDLVAGIASGSVRNNITLSNFVNNQNWQSGQWNHVAVVYNVNSIALYLNGVAVASNNSLSFLSVGNSSNASRIGMPSGTGSSNSVFNDGSYSNYQGYIDNLFIIKGALSAAEINTLRTNTFAPSFATTLTAPAPPSNPSGLVANVLSTNEISLTWNDNSANETAFEIWRASGDKSNYRAITKINGGSGAQKLFKDTTLFANVTYYYKVRAIGEVAPSGFSSEVNAKTMNSKPVLKQIQNFSMRYGTSFALPVWATDRDGDLLTFTAGNLPSFGVFETVSNGNVNIVFSPGVTRRGSYPITVYVTDGNNGKDSSVFTLTVNTNDVPVMSEVSDIVINEGGNAQINVSATDNDGTANMVWVFEGLPSFATFTNNNNGLGSISFRPGFSSSGEYPVTIIVNDGFGAWTSRTMNLTVIEKDPEETIQLNFRTQSASVPLWNNINLAPPTFTHGALTDTKSNSLPVALTLVSGSITASVQGPQTGNNSGVYPDLVMKDIMLWGFNNGNNAKDTLVVKVSGLDAGKKYNFVFYSGYNLNGIASSVSRFRIGDQMATINYFQNTSMSDTIVNATPDATGSILITMIGDPAPTRGGVLNAMVIKSVFDDGTTPASPLNFSGAHIQNEGVKLTWEDRAYNEEAYHIYRSTNKTSGYSLLNPDASNKDSSLYIDEAVAPETVYYYYVAGFNLRGTGISSDTIKITTGNNKPMIGAPDNIYVKTGSTENVNFPVTDDAGDVVTLSIENNPSFVRLENTGGSGYRLVASPVTDHIGWYILKLKASDQKGAVATKLVRVNVSDKNTRSVYIKFGRAGKIAPSPWNNWLGTRSANSTIANLKDEKNAITPFSVTMANSWSGLNDLGHVTGNNSGVYPDSVLQTGLSDGGGPKTIVINGLNDAMKYNIVIAASQNEGTNATVEYSSGTTKDTLNARYNTNQTANLNGLTPVGGQLSFTALRIGGSVTSFLNALVIEEYAPSIGVLNPINLYAEAVDQNKIDLSWSDRTLEEDISGNYIIERATDSLFTQNVVSVSLPGNTTTFRNMALSPNTKYWYRVRARSAGGSFSEYSNRAKAIAAASVVYVNFNYTLPDAEFPWNNTFASPTFEGSFDNLINQNGSNSGISLTLTKIFNGEFTAGVVTNDNSGVVPDNALASNYWLDNTQLSQFKISGLNHSRRYRVGFFGSSSSNGWTKGNYTATYTIKGKTVYLNSWMNSTKIVYIDDVVPDENGELFLDFSTTADAAYGFNGGVIIHDYTDPSAGGNVILNPAVVEHESVFNTVNESEVGAERTMEASTVRMYPNPFTDFVNMDFNNTSEANGLSIEVYDLSGRIGYRRNIGSLPKGNNTVRLSAAEAGLNTGIYIVTLTANGKILQASKLMKIKK